MDTLSWVYSVISTTPERWNRLAESIPAELLREQPAPGEWSALECLQHLVDTERSVFAARIQAILAGKDFPAFDPDCQGTPLSKDRTAVELAAEFDQLRANSLKILEQVTPDDVGRTARHAELGVVTMSELLNEWAAHDLNHTVQGERAIMQPFILGCGPWQSYFKDHLISK